MISVRWYWDFNEVAVRIFSLGKNIYELGFNGHQVTGNEGFGLEKPGSRTPNQCIKHWS